MSDGAAATALYFDSFTVPSAYALDALDTTSFYSYLHLCHSMPFNALYLYFCFLVILNDLAHRLRLEPKVDSAHTRGTHHSQCSKITGRTAIPFQIHCSSDQTMSGVVRVFIGVTVELPLQQVDRFWIPRFGFPRSGALFYANVVP